MTVWPTRVETDALFAMEEHRVDDQRWRLPDMLDFVIPKPRATSEPIVRAISKPNRSTAENLMIAWADSTDSKPESFERFGFLNDNEKSISVSMTDALRNYGITSVVGASVIGPESGL